MHNDPHTTKGGRGLHVEMKLAFKRYEHALACGNYGEADEALTRFQQLASAERAARQPLQHEFVLLRKSPGGAT